MSSEFSSWLRHDSQATVPSPNLVNEGNDTCSRGCFTNKGRAIPLRASWESSVVQCYVEWFFSCSLLSSRS